MFSHEEKYITDSIFRSFNTLWSSCSFQSPGQAQAYTQVKQCDTVSTQKCKKCKERFSAFTCKYPHLRMIWAESEYLQYSTVPFLNLMPKCILYDLFAELFSDLTLCKSKRCLKQTFWRVSRRSTCVVNNTNDGSIRYSGYKASLMLLLPPGLLLLGIYQNV